MEVGNLVRWDEDVRGTGGLCGTGRCMWKYGRGVKETVGAVASEICSMYCYSTAAGLTREPLARSMCRGRTMNRKLLRRRSAQSAASSSKSMLCSR